MRIAESVRHLKPKGFEMIAEVPDNNRRSARKHSGQTQNKFRGKYGFPAMLSKKKNQYRKAQ